MQASTEHSICTDGGSSSMGLTASQAIAAVAEHCPPYGHWRDAGSLILGANCEHSALEFAPPTPSVNAFKGQRRHSFRPEPSYVALCYKELLLPPVRIELTTSALPRTWSAITTRIAARSCRSPDPEQRAAYARLALRSGRAEIHHWLPSKRSSADLCAAARRAGGGQVVRLCQSRIRLGPRDGKQSAGVTLRRPPFTIERPSRQPVSWLLGGYIQSRGKAGIPSLSPVWGKGPTHTATGVVPLRGLEPLTPSLRMMCSTS